MRPFRFPLRVLIGKLCLIAWFAWLLILCVFSSKSQLPPMPSWNHVDKIMHAGYFFVGGILWASAMSLHPKVRTISWKGLLFLGIVTLSVIGALDEWHQTFTPGRFGLDVGDWLADTLGAVLGVPLGLAASRWLIKFSSRSQA